MAESISSTVGGLLKSFGKTARQVGTRLATGATMLAATVAPSLFPSGVASAATLPYSNHCQTNVQGACDTYAIYNEGLLGSSFTYDPQLLPDYNGSFFTINGTPLSAQGTSWQTSGSGVLPAPDASEFFLPRSAGFVANLDIPDSFFQIRVRYESLYADRPVQAALFINGDEIDNRIIQNNGNYDVYVSMLANNIDVAFLVAPPEGLTVDNSQRVVYVDVGFDNIGGPDRNNLFTPRDITKFKDTLTEIPEPESIILLGTAAAGLGLLRRRQQKTANKPALAA